MFKVHNGHTHRGVGTHTSHIPISVHLYPSLGLWASSHFQKIFLSVSCYLVLWPLFYLYFMLLIEEKPCNIDRPLAEGFLSLSIMFSRCTHFATKDPSIPFFMVEQCSAVCKHIFFTCISGGGHRGCSHGSAVMSYTAMSLAAHGSLWNLCLVWVLEHAGN